LVTYAMAIGPQAEGGWTPLDPGAWAGGATGFDEELALAD